MTIKEIARLAEVSVSTVSKIINKKDSNISRETRERVLKIVKEYHYAPYAQVKAQSKSVRFLIGIMLNGNAGHSLLLSSIMDKAQEQGYSTLVCTSYDAEEEYKNLSSMISRQVDGVLWDRLEGSLPQAEADLLDRQVPYHVIDCAQEPSAENSCFDYTKLGYRATQELIQHKHSNLLCLLAENDGRSRNFRKGFQKCLFDNKIPSDANMVHVWHQEEKFSLLLHRYTGIICTEPGLACKIYEEAVMQNLNIPKDLSVISLNNGQHQFYLSPPLSTISLPFRELGEYACLRLIDRIEKKQAVKSLFHQPVQVDHEQSIDVPPTLRNKKIVVVGTINMDTLIGLGKFPRMGETVTTGSRVMVPGGKGLNQALGVAKLGAEAYLIGKVGKDYEGSVLYEFLGMNNVNIDGVSTEKKLSTGHAYIYVQEDGESGIVIYDGANSCLSIADVEKHEEMFAHASFCLLPTEIKPEVVEYTARTARKYKAKVLLKPAAVSVLSDDLLQNVDILMPNKNEIHTLLPEIGTYEEQAQYYLDRGVGTVIITLGHEGCYLRDPTRSRYFEAANFVPVDTTGAADAFAATLAVYLSKNYDIETAIGYATYAAGLSTTRQGVPNSLVDQSTLDLYISDI